MACNIAINDVIGIDNNLEVEEIIVSGTAEDCESVKVEVNISDATFIEIVDVDDGIWTAHIEVEDVKCNASYSIEVSCVDGEEDCVQSVSGILICRTPGCPVLENDPVFVEEPCNENSERNLNISFSINAPEVVLATIDLGNGILDNRGLIPGLNPISYRPPLNILPYAPGGHNIRITFEGECDPINIPFGVNACEIPNECLELIASEIISIGACNEDGTRNVEFRMTINSPVPQRITVNFGEDTSVEEVVLNGENELVWEEPSFLQFSPGRIEGTIVSDNCPDVPFVIEILECAEIECPIIWGDFTPLRITCQGRNSLVITSVVYDNRSNEAVRATIDYGNNQNVEEVNLVPGDNHILPLEVEYESRDEPYNIVIRTEDKCEEKTIPIGIIQDCRECPEFGDVSYEFGDCYNDGDRRMREVIVMFGYDSTHPCQIIIDFGNHGRFPFNLEREQNSAFREMIHLPVNEPLRGQIIIECDDLECPNQPLAIKTVPNCEGDGCGSFEVKEIHKGECVDGRAEVTVVVEVKLAIDTRVHIDYGDGTSEDQVMEAGEYDESFTHTYPDEANPTIELSQDFPDNCEPTSISIGEIECNPEIPPGGNEGGDGGESGWCISARWLIAIGTAISILAGLLMICVPAAIPFLTWVVAISAGIALLAIVARAIASWLDAACPSPCGMTLLITWQAMLGAGVGALYLMNCCPWMLWSGLGLIVSALLLAKRWANNCNMSGCRVLGEISSVLVGVVIPVYTTISSNILIRPCVNNVFEVLIPWISGALAIWAISCLVRNNP
jgi:hypothetical protein